MWVLDESVIFKQECFAEIPGGRISRGGRLKAPYLCFKSSSLLRFFKRADSAAKHTFGGSSWRMTNPF